MAHDAYLLISPALVLPQILSASFAVPIRLTFSRGLVRHYAFSLDLRVPNNDRSHKVLRVLAAFLRLQRKQSVCKFSSASGSPPTAKGSSWSTSSLSVLPHFLHRPPSRTMMRARNSSGIRSLLGLARYSSLSGIHSRWWPNATRSLS